VDSSAPSRARSAFLLDDVANAILRLHLVEVEQAFKELNVSSGVNFS
jgi:hypothetical protein